MRGWQRICEHLIASNDLRVRCSARANRSRFNHELDLKAQKAVHSQSLIFDAKIAGSQDFETIYQICLEGFHDLCQLDQRFLDFERNIFNAQSKDQDRIQMTAEENEALDNVLEHFLSLVGSRLLLRPAVKALEWLIRRFKVHTYNTSYLISTFLPYYEGPIFQNLLSILPPNLPVQYKFLRPYLKTATNPPRHAIVYSATSSDPFFATLCSYTLQACRQDASYPLLLNFWASIATEAVAGRLALTQSGRREVQQQRQEDVLLKVIPLLNDGLALQDVPEMVLACYTIIVILTNKVDLADEVIDSLMEAIALSLSIRDLHSGIVCLSILIGRKSSKTASKKCLGSLIQRSDLPESLRSVDKSCPVGALVQALAWCALQGLNKKNYMIRLQFVATIATSTEWLSENVTIFVQGILQAITSMSDNDAVSSSIRARLVDVLRRLCQIESYATSLRQSASELGISRTDLESLLGQVLFIPGDDALEVEDDVDMETDSLPEPDHSLEDIFKHIPERTVTEHSFLTSTDTPLFGLLSDAYQASCKRRNGNAKFRALSVWHTTSHNGTVLQVTFLLRIASGSYPDACRAAALRSITQMIEDHDQPLDSQAILFYILPRLADPAHSIRRAASETLIAMQSKAPQDILEDDECQTWGNEDLYDGDKMKDIRWLPTSDLAIVLKLGFLPTLEECVADPTHIFRIVQQVFLPGTLPAKASHHRGTSTVKLLQKTLRHSLFESLLSHIGAMPLLTLKIDLIKLLQGVDRVGSTIKAKALKPMVQQWAALSDEDVEILAKKQMLGVPYVDNGVVKIVTSSDKDAASLLLDLVVDMKQTPRSSFLDHVFDHLQSIWPNMSPDARAAGAQKLIDLSLSASVLSERARAILSSLELPAEALERVLKAAFSVALDVQNTTPSRKRRRSSSNIKPSISIFNTVGLQMTLALELIDGSKPEQHPELLMGLFDALSTLQSLKRLSQRDFPYLLNLCLSSMLAIVRKLGPSPKTKKDLAAARIELVTDCIRRSDSPQVQNAAILLSAELARVVPEKILHNAMPIFTFLGSHAPTMGDEYSEYVVNQAIDHIIPSLMHTLQAQRKDMSGVISDLLSSFSAAFEHIAEHRRLGLFQRLISKLGTDGVLNTLVAMLMVRNTNSTDVGAFVRSLLSSFPIDIQLRALHDLINQTIQISEGDNDLAKMLTATDIIDNDASMITLRTMLIAAERILEATNLGAALKLSNQVAANLKSQILNTLRLLMQLSRDTAENEELNLAVEHCTATLLDLIPLAEFLDLNARVLANEDTNYHQDALLMLETRLSSATKSDSGSRKAALAMLPTLTDLISDKEHDRVKHGAIRCMDRITAICGRRDTAAIVQAAKMLSTSQAITSEKPALQTVASLCLASMLDCAKEAIIPIVPKVMSMSIAVLKNSLIEDAEDDRLHDAAYALISAIISNVSFMISEGDLDNIMKLSAESSNAGLGQQSHTARQDTLALLSRNVEIKYIIPSLQRTWSIAIENDVNAAIQALDVLSNSIKRATKASVMAVADQVSNLFTQMLDLRRVQFTTRDEDSYTEGDVSIVEGKVNKVAVEFIYKLNDTIFRPILTQWMEWAIKCPGVPAAQLERAKTHRQTSVFRFLADFFGILKSIVTSYVTHVLEPAVDVLQSTVVLARLTSENTPTLDMDQQVLWSATLDMLAEACRYDQDSFFASPSHFPTLAETLVAQLKLASDKTLQTDIQEHVLPALVALAFATADTVEHCKELNHQICLLRHAEATGVRMASIQAQHALVESDDVGEEWVNNVIQGGGEIMVYINEMLEDDDEDVEREVRKWVRRIREMVGEDLFEV